MPYSPTVFRITINNMTGPAPADGFIDHIPPEAYPSSPANLANGYKKARAFARFKHLIFRISETQTPIRTFNYNNGGATIDSEGSQFEFYAEYERPDEIYTYNELVNEVGHPTYGVPILYGLDALKRMAARVFVYDFKANEAWIRHPDTDGLKWGDEEFDVGAPTAGSLRNRIDTAEAQITVTVVV